MSLPNNTSASDSFPGWPNGIPKAGEVSKLPFDFPQVKILHVLGWWGTGSHPNIGYNSAEISYADRRAADIADRGWDVVDHIWHGSGSQEEKSAKALRFGLNKRGKKLMLMIGSSTSTLKLPPEKFPDVTSAQRTAVLKNILDYLRSQFFSDPTYFRPSFQSSSPYFKYNGRPMLAFFGVTGVDWNDVRFHVSTWGLDQPIFIRRHQTGDPAAPQADGCFGWTDFNEAWITSAKARYAGKLIMGGLNHGFDNTHHEPPVNITWGTPHVISQDDGMRFISQMATFKLHPEIWGAHGNTYDDYQEGTPQEPGIDSHRTLILGFSGDTQLWWNDVGLVFDRYELSYSLGLNEIITKTMSPGITKFDLSSIVVPGVYQFQIKGIGKPGILNIVSSSILLKLELIPKWNLT